MKFYKYRKINKNTISLVENLMFHFSFPDDFNDPFDCKVNVAEINGPDQLLKFIELNKISKMKRLEIESMAKSGVLNEYIQKANRNMNAKYLAVYCLSKKSDNILMWSHYSDSHKGLCLVFRSETNNNQLFLGCDDESISNRPDLFYNKKIELLKVNYSVKKLPPFKIFNLDKTNFKEYLLIKAIDWKYESEYRMTIPFYIIKKQDLKMSKSILSEVIFGAKTSPEDIALVTNIIKKKYWDHGYEVDISKMECSQDNYRLIKKRLTI